MKLLWLLLALLLPSAAIAGSNPDFVEIKGGVPVVLKPDRAYIYFRTVKGHGILDADPVFLRDLVGDEFLGPPNLSRTHGGNRYTVGEGEDSYLIEVKPGNYVIVGLTDKSANTAITCLCMGTVRFEAKAGVITDLGHLATDRVDQRSTIPELRDVTGRGGRVNGLLFLLVATIRPDAETASVPATLRNLPRVPADFRAFGKFVNRIAETVNRMAPIPGVLAYDEDRVIDVKAALKP